MACSHAPPELLAPSGRYWNTKISELDRFCGYSYVWLVPECYLIDQAN
jgi:hypothetical protein